jgi:hypothetical protein
MVLGHNQMTALMRLLSMTRDHELNCNECLDQMGEFAEHELAGKPVRRVLEDVQHHLGLCSQCAEEYEALLEALRQTKEKEDREK